MRLLHDPDGVTDWTATGVRSPTTGLCQYRSAKLDTHVYCLPSAMTDTFASGEPAPTPEALFVVSGEVMDVAPQSSGGMPSTSPPVSTPPVDATPPPTQRPPSARNTDPPTSHDAAAAKRKYGTGGDKALVLLAHADAGDRGLTGEELEQKTGRRYASIGPRRPALCDAGWLLATDQTRPNTRGRNEQVFTITPFGLAAAHEIRKGVA